MCSAASEVRQFDEDFCVFAPERCPVQNGRALVVALATLATVAALLAAIAALLAAVAALLSAVAALVAAVAALLAATTAVVAAVVGVPVVSHVLCRAGMMRSAGGPATDRAQELTLRECCDTAGQTVSNSA